MQSPRRAARWVGVLVALFSAALLLVSANQVASGATSLPGRDLALWLKADAGVTLDHSTVARWSDQSGSDHHAIQAQLGARPNLIERAVNGRPAIHFDGQSDSLTVPLPINKLAGLTIFLVSRPTGEPTALLDSAAALAWPGDDPSGATYLSPQRSSIRLQFGARPAGSASRFDRPAPLLDFSLTTALKDRDREALYVDGNAAWQASGRRSPLASVGDTASIGRGDGSTFFAGDIAEILIYRRALADSERLLVERYLTGRYVAAAAPPTPAPAPTAAAAGRPEPLPTANRFRYGLFDDGNLYSRQRMRTVLDQMASLGLNSIMLTNGSAASGDALLSVSDSRDVDVVLGPQADLNDRWWSGTTPATLAQAHRVLDPLVDRLKTHPSLKGYYLADEPGTDLTTRLQLAVQAVRERDPTRPSSPVLIGTDRVGPLFDAAQPGALAIDVYPIGLENPPCDLTMSGFGYSMDMVEYIRQVTAPKPVTTPLWLVLQTHGLAAADLRQPSVAELRLQHWIALGEGAQAIYWFAYTSQQGWTGLEDAPALRSELSSLARRLKNLRDPLANARRVASQLTASHGAYASTLQSNDGKHTYIVVANRSCGAATVTLTGATGTLRNLETGKTSSVGAPLQLPAGDGAMFELTAANAP